MRRWLVAGAAACALAACGPRGDRTPSPGGPAGAAGAAGAAAGAAPARAGEAPEARARAFLQRQIEAALGGDRGALQATFAQGAVVLVPGAPGGRAPDSVSHFGIGDAGFGGVTSRRAAIGKLAAGGTADAVWLYAEVAIEYEGPVDGEVQKGRGMTRVVELIAAAEGWRAVAASFTAPREPEPSGDNAEITGATAADGPLAKLAAAPGALAASLGPDAIVVGPARRQLAIGGPGTRATRDALAAWKLEPLSLYRRAREVRTEAWGFVQANLDRPAPDGLIERLSVQLFAIPAGGGAWRVVLAQYLAQ